MDKQYWKFWAAQVVLQIIVFNKLYTVDYFYKLGFLFGKTYLFVIGLWIGCCDRQLDFLKIYMII